MPPDTESYNFCFAVEGAPPGYLDTMEVEKAGSNMATLRCVGCDDLDPAQKAADGSPDGVRTEPSKHTRKSGEHPDESANAKCPVEEAAETGIRAVEDMMDHRSQHPSTGDAVAVPPPETLNSMGKSPVSEPEPGDAVVEPSSTAALEGTSPKSAETPSPTVEGEAEPVGTGDAGEPQGSTPTPSQALVVSALQDMRQGPARAAVEDQWERMENWLKRLEMFKEWKKSSPSFAMTILSVEEVSFNAATAIVSGDTSLPELSVMRPEYHPVQILGTWDWRTHPTIVSEAADMTPKEILRKLGVVPRLTR